MHKTVKIFTAALIVAGLISGTVWFAFDWFGDPGAEAAITTYNFAGCSTTCDTSASWFASQDDVDQFPFGGSTANQNTHTQANDTQFSQIASSDDIRWTSVDPGAGDEVFVWNEMTISENPAHIQQIDLTWEGFLTGGSSATFSIWVLNASQAANWQTDANWTQVGTTQSISGTSDTTMTRSITTNFSDYISGSGLLIWGVYESVSSESLNTDYVKADVTYRVTTLGNGTNPGNAAVAPGSSAIDLDSFTLQTDVGSASVSGVTVALSAGSSGGLSSVAVTNNGGTVTYCSQADPGSDTVVLISCAIPVTTTQTQFKVRITPKSHSTMPSPPGSTYSVTGTVSSITSGDSQTSGSDASSATITIDNASPANVTSASGSAGNGQVSLTWTNPGDSDFHSGVVLRRASSAVTDTPVEGVTYSVGNAIGSSVVACVEASPSTGCTDAGLANGTAYHYKIFSRDNNNNYATGAVPTGFPFTPTAPANTPPTLSISEPNGVGDSVTVGDSFNITYTLSDPDNVVTAAFYYDTDNSGLNGTAISGACATAAEGTGATCSWNTTGVTPGSYYVYGITNDGTNPQVSAYSGDTITINAVANTAPTLSISEPNGTSDTIAQDASFTITYTLSDPDNVVTAAFYYDTNGSGLDGTAISGACATAAEGTGATCSWNTTGVTPGNYFVYGITNDGTNPQVSAYSGGTMTINARPTLSISQPDGASDTVTQGDLYNVTYSLADSDNAVTAAFYYDTNGSGLDGTAITGACATAAEGSGVTCSWNTTGVTPGSYFVYGITNDGTNAQVSAYSGGMITISTPANVAPSLSISQPDGVGDSVTVGDSFAVTYTLSDSDNVVTAAFYYDTNNTGLDGTAISGCGSVAEGTGATCSWNTTGVTPGNYFVYGITNDGTNPQVSAYSGGAMTVNAVPVISVSSISPTAGALAGGTSVTISGSNFQSGATVKLGGISATSVVFVSSSSLTATTPAHAAGSVDVLVTNPDLTSDTLIGGFTYTSSPVVTITASPVSIFTGESSVINWSTENATACTASGAWSGSKATSGNETVAPASSSTYTLECTGVGGSGSGSAAVTVTTPGGAPKEPGVLFRFDGFAYPDGKVFLYDNGVPFSQLISDLSGRFATSLRLASIAEKHLFSIIAYDKEGNVSPNKTFPTQLYERGGLTDILIAPTIMLNKRALGNGESLRISGYATPGNKVQIEIDGKIVGTVPVTASGYYTFAAPLSSFAKGDHRARSIQVTAQSRMSDYSLLKAFQISDPFVVYADLNNDGKLTISDWSIFLSSWVSREEDVRRKIDFNGDGKISIFDLSVFLSGFRNR